MSESGEARFKTRDPPYGWCIVGAALFLNVVSGAHFDVMSVFLVEFEDHFQLSQQKLSIMAGVRASLVDFSGRKLRQRGLRNIKLWNINSNAKRYQT